MPALAPLERQPRSPRRRVFKASTVGALLVDALLRRLGGRQRLVGRTLRAAAACQQIAASMER